MLSVYFLLGVFGVAILGCVIALFFAFRWHNEERGGGAAVIAAALFAVACISGSHVYWRLEASDRAAVIQRP
jgi:uncharacterized membrane protein